MIYKKLFFHQTKFSDIIISEPFIDNWSTIHGSYFFVKGRKNKKHIFTEDILPSRGDIYVADMNTVDSMGHILVHKRRPVIVVQNDLANNHHRRQTLSRLQRRQNTQESRYWKCGRKK